MKVLEAAAIGVPHPKWTERPLLVVVPHPGQKPSKDELLSYFQVRSAYRQPAVMHLTKELFIFFSQGAWPTEHHNRMSISLTL